MGLRKLIACLIFNCIFFSHVNAQWLWADDDKGDYCNPQAITADRNSNVYVTGFYVSSINFGNILLSDTVADYAFFVAKYNNAGTVIWAQTATGTAMGTGVSTDQKGNVYVSGYYDSSFTIGAYTFLSEQDNAGIYDYFIAKYDSSGNLLWVKTSNSVYGSTAHAITTDTDGYVYLAGDYDTAVAFGSTVMPGSGSNLNVFVAKLDSSGNLIWSRDISNSGSGIGVFGICLDTGGNIYVTGESDTSTFTQKFNSSGTEIWRRTAAGDNNWGTGIKTDMNGNVYVTGSNVGDTVIFGDLIIAYEENGSFNNCFIVKYDSSGNVIWGQNASIDEGAVSNGLCVDGDGGVYLSGYFEGNGVSFGDVSLSGDGYLLTAFLVKYDSTGNAVWAIAPEGNSFSEGNGVATDIFGNLYFTGFFSNAITFGSTSFNDTTSGVGDMFVAGLYNCIQPPPATNTTGDSALNIKSGNNTTLTASGIGTISWYSTPYGYGYLGSGTSFTTPVLTDTTTFYAYDSTCEASNPISITVSVTCVPPAPPVNITSPSNDTVQYENVTQLTVSGTGTFGWYSANGEYLGGGSTFYTPALDTTTTFYVQDSTCRASTRTAITVTVIGGCTPPAPPTNTSSVSALTIYSGNITELSASGTGTIGWYSADSDGNYLGGGSTFYTPPLDSTTTFYVQDSTCGASSRTAITVTVTGGCAPPAAPTNTSSASAQTIFEGNITELSASGTGALGWYSADSGGNYLGGGAAFYTPALDSTTTFYVQDSTCGASTRTAITVTVIYGAGIATVKEGNNITVYPNPSGSVFNFGGVKSGYLIEIYNELGEVIYSTTIDRNNYPMDLSGNAKGVYLYRVLNQGTFIQQGKIVLE